MMNNKKVTFKYYNMDQLKLPMELEVCIPDNHLVKIVNSAIEKMNIDPLIAVQRRRYKCLSPQNDAQSPRLCLFPKSLFLKKNSQGT
jgi:transposase